MSWFCGSSKKRRNKSKVSSIPSEPSTSAPVLTNGKPSYIVVLQDFDSAVSDELSVRRGQALEALYTNKDWIYVKDIVSRKSGYVPQTFCYPLDGMGSGSFQDYASLHRPRPKNLQLDMEPVTNHGSQNSVGVSQIQDRVGSQVTVAPVSRGVSVATTQDSTDGQVTMTPVLRRASVATQQHENIDGQVTMTPVSRVSGTTQQETVSRRASVVTQQESIDTTPVARRASMAIPRDGHINSTPVTRRASMPNALDRQVNLTPVVGRQALVVTQDSTLSQVTQQPTHQRILASRSQGNLASELIVATEMSTTTDKQSTNSIQTPVGESTNASSIRARRAQRLSCPPDRELTLEAFQYTPYSASRANSIKRSVSMNDGAQGRARIRPRALPVTRTQSYREAVRSNVEQVDSAGTSSSERLRNTFDEPSGGRRLSSNGSPGCTRKNCDCSRRPKPNARRNRLRKQPFVEYDSSDVFLPNTKHKKPYGIFRCTEDHQPTIDGEVAVQKNELIIVLDYGRKEWAWIITSHHIEGLVPKRLLTRYESDRGTTGVKMVDQSTQTELIVSGDVRQVASGANPGMSNVRQVSTASNASMGTSNARQVSSASSASGPSVCGTMTPPETTPQSAQTAAIESSKSLTVPSSDWFSFTDSLERPSHTTKLSTPPMTRRLPESAPVTPISPTSRQPRRLSTVVDRKKSLSSRVLTNRGTPILTAAKDYQPPEKSKNCLSLKKGDVLTAQSHMHYPKGWMWVWHPEQRRFGYVPNSSVAYSYPVTRSNRTGTIEDEV